MRIQKNNLHFVIPQSKEEEICAQKTLESYTNDARVYSDFGSYDRWIEFVKLYHRFVGGKSEN